MSDIRVSNLDLTPENGISPKEKRFSKVNGKVCKLKMKVFSSDGVAKEIEYSDTKDINPVISVDLGEEKLFNDDKEVQTEVVSETTTGEQKGFSVTSIKFSAVA